MNSDQANKANQSFQQFLNWEASTRDVLDVKRVYIDLAGDLAAGVALSEIVYWYLPNKKGETRLRVEHEGHLWIAAPRSQWWERCRLSPEQADYALGKLVRKGLLEKRVFKFNGQPTVHLRLQVENFLAQLQALITAPQLNPYLQIREQQGKLGNFPIGTGNTSTREWESEPKPLTETPYKDSPPPQAMPATKVFSGNDFPKTPLEADRNPDLALFRRITGVISPGKVDWQVIIERIRYLRLKHLDLEDDDLVEAGRPYYVAWIGRGYSRTHPDWLEWWMNEAIPPERHKHKHTGRKVSDPEPQYNYAELRKKAELELRPMIAQFEQKGS